MKNKVSNEDEYILRADDPMICDDSGGFALGFFLFFGIIFFGLYFLFIK